MEYSPTYTNPKLLKLSTIVLMSGMFLMFSIQGCKKEDPVFGNITGIVISKGVGVSGALVELISNAQVVQTEVSSSLGLFSFSGVPLGDYELQVSKEGYFDLTSGLRVSNATIQEVEVSLLPESGSIAGRVFDEAGNGVEEVLVELSLEGTYVNQTTTNSSGDYAFDNVEIGIYELSFEKEGYLSGKSSAVVTAAQISQVSFTLTSAKGDLRVYVLDAFGGEILDSYIEIYKGQDLVATASLLQSFVLFAEDLNAGDYTLLVSRSGFEDTELPVTVIHDTEVEATAELEARSLPSGGLTGSTVSTFTGTSATFELELFVVDEEGEFIEGLPHSAFTLNNGTFGNFEFEFEEVSFGEVTSTASESYSAAMLIDQSGSIFGTDPNNSRVQASKHFMSALGSGDNAALAAFSSGVDSQLPDELTIFNNSAFSSDGAVFFDDLDGLKSTIGGGTPLFRSTVDMVSFTSVAAPNGQKAVIVFTDGEDTDGSATITEAINIANNNNVSLFTVGLGAGTDVFVLGEMANRTNGAFMNANEAEELVALFGSLGKLLTGTATTYKLTWTVESNAPAFPGRFSTVVHVETPEGNLQLPLYVDVGGPSARIGNKPTYGNYPHTTVHDR